MSPWTPNELEAGSRRLGPYAQHSLENASFLAARLHAKEVSPEHWLAALMADEDCAATRAVLHAFADPETIGVEVLALCEGIMLVGSSRTLPFSVLGVEVVEDALEVARARGGQAVEPSDVFWTAIPRLGAELGARLTDLPGIRLDRPEAHGGGNADTLDGPLFRNYSANGLRCLGAGGRSAASLGRTAIAPAHLLMGALEIDEGLREQTCLTAARVRMVGSGMDEDRTPLPERRLVAAPRLPAMLGELPVGAGTLDALGWMLARGSEELISLLRRQKVTTALFERCRGVYQDPDSPAVTDRGPGTAP